VPTVGGSIIQNARRVPDRAAIIAGDQRWTWRELDAQVARVAGTLERAGLGKGDRFGIVADNSPGFLISMFAASRLGAIVVPINTRLAVPEVEHILGDSGCAIIAVSCDHLLRITEAVKTLRPKVFALGPNSEHPDLLDVSGSAATVANNRAGESDDAFIVYTSGTTGRPKGVLLDHHRAVWAAMAQIVSLGLRDGDRYLHLAPLYHSGGVVFLNAVTLLGGTHILISAFEPHEVLMTIEQEHVNVLLGVPTMYQFLLRHPDIDRRDLSTWRIGVFGAAPMPSTAVETMLSKLPHVRFYQQCGQTEAGPTGIYSTSEQVRAEPDSSGHLAQPFIEARVVGPDGADVTPGAIGELVLRGEPIMKGYWENPAATNATIRDGWLHTGDLFLVSPNGSMKLVDRLKDVIITGGRNVYSAEVEQVLLLHPDIIDCAVIGRPHPDWGATVVTVITPRAGAQITAEQVRRHCRTMIADYKIPREIVLGPIPRNASGKVRKNHLREQFESAAESGL
jgi:fatty-acyl-CoA synthase/feruloyl-CoA synthase